MTSTSPLYSTLTTTALGICVLIDVKICSGSTPTASSVLTLTVALTGATLGIHWRVTSWALAVILAHDGFVACTVGIPYDFMASLMHPSLSSTAFWFLLYLVQSSLAIWPAY
jgi:hypothetical protein